jgi:hypothetical protein
MEGFIFLVYLIPTIKHFVLYDFDATKNFIRAQREEYTSDHLHKFPFSMPKSSGGLGWHSGACVWGLLRTFTDFPGKLLINSIAKIQP